MIGLTARALGAGAILVALLLAAGLLQAGAP